MNHNIGSAWLMGLGAWLLQTVAILLVGIVCGALGFAAWMLFQVISAGVSALNI
jgi:hypothetical protein